MSDLISSGAFRPVSGFNLLNRVQSNSHEVLSASQGLVDHAVGSAVEEATKGSTLAALLGAGFAYRLTRAGVLSFGEAGALLPRLTQGASYAFGLAGESATFTAIERGFHPSSASFGKDWARAFVNLGSLKLLGGAAAGQNPILQHLMADLGMVGGQEAASRVGLMDSPQGSLAERMLQAEALNWSMKGSAALLHGLSPRIVAGERSLDLYLQSRPQPLSVENPLSFSPQLATEGASAAPGVPISDRESGPSREHIFLAKADPMGGAAFPTPEQISQEIGSLHQSWIKKGGKIQIEGSEVTPETVDLGKLQTAMWDLKSRPIIVGSDPLESKLWGRMRNFFANLNNPPELYKRDLGHPYYLLGLSIALGRNLESISLPAEVHQKIQQYSQPPLHLLWAKHQWGTGENRTLQWPAIVQRFFGGNGTVAENFAREAQGESWMKIRGWSGVSKALSTTLSGDSSASSSTESARRRTPFNLTLEDLGSIIPETGGAPTSHLDITEAVRKGGFENVLKDGYSLGWWTRLPQVGGYQANILGRVADFKPEAIYDLLSRREEWPVFYPGFYLVERVRPLTTADQAIYRLAMKTPVGRIRMFTKHTIVPSEFQVRWEDPEDEYVKRLDIGLEQGEKKISRIQGSITAAPSPSGDGSLLLYELFMTAQQTGTGNQVDPFADLKRNQVATMARVPPLLTSLSAKLAANRDGQPWGIYDPAKLAAYKESRDPLKGPPPEGVVYHPNVWVIEK